jgi:hypothetical protein
MEARSSRRRADPLAIMDIRAQLPDHLYLTSGLPTQEVRSPLTTMWEDDQGYEHIDHSDAEEPGPDCSSDTIVSGSLKQTGANTLLSEWDDNFNTFDIRPDYPQVVFRVRVPA